MEYDVNVVGGQLVLLSKALLPAIKTDVLNSLLSIQLYADNGADKFGQFRAWNRRQVEAQVNTKWTTTCTQTSGHEVAPQAEVTITALATKYLANILKQDTPMPSDAVALAINAVMQSTTAQEAFVNEGLRTNPVQLSRAVDGTSNIIVQVCVVEPKASIFSVEINLSIGAVLDADVFVHPVKGVGVVGEVEVTVSRLELDLVGYKEVRNDVLYLIEHLNARRKSALRVIEVSVPSPVIVEHAVLPR